jgi:hypothetical protein
MSVPLFSLVIGRAIAGPGAGISAEGTRGHSRDQPKTRHVDPSGRAKRKTGAARVQSCVCDEDGPDRHGRPIGEHAGPGAFLGSGLARRVGTDIATRRD